MDDDDDGDDDGDTDSDDDGDDTHDVGDIVVMMAVMLTWKKATIMTRSMTGNSRMPRDWMFPVEKRLSDTAVFSYKFLVNYYARSFKVDIQFDHFRP